MLEIVLAECWRLERYLSVSLTPWAVSAAVMRDGGALTLLHCVVSCYQPQSFSGDTFLMFYLTAGVETRVANTSDSPNQEQSAPSQKVVK